MTTENFVPRDIEAEQSLLGSLLMDKNAINKVITMISKDDFYNENHKRTYKVIEDIYNDGDDIDLIIVNSKLKDFKWYQNVGTQSYLIELMNTVPTASHVITYAKTIRKNKVLRDLIDAGQTITSMGSSIEDEENVDVLKLIDDAQQKIFNIADKGISNEFYNVEDYIKSSIDKIREAKTNTTRGVPTGFKLLDDILSGLQKSDLIILAARPAMGKSSLAMDIARNVALNEDKSVAFFSLEMSKEQLIDRLISSEAKVDSWKMRSGEIDKDSPEFSKINDVTRKVHGSKLFINDTPSITVLQMRTMARKLKAKNGLDLIVVDYLQLIQPTNSKASEVAQMTEISRQLKIMAKELDVPVLALSQLSRAVEQRIPAIPRLSDLRTSGSIEQDADIVMFIYREEVYNENTPNKGIAEIIISKHRNGAIGKIKVPFEKQYSSFNNEYIIR